MVSIPARSEIAPEYQWNAPSLFESPDAWKAAYDEIASTLPEIEKYKGHLGDSPAALADWFEQSAEWSRKLGKVFVYALMEQAVNTTNEAANAMADQTFSLFGRYQAAVSFEAPELLQLGEETLRRWTAEEERLKPYAHHIDNLFRQQAHVRSAEVEELLGLVSDPFNNFDNTAEQLVSADIQFAPARSGGGDTLEVGQGSIDALLASPDREVRRTAWESYADGYLSIKNGLASNLVGSIKRDVFYMRARRYDSTLEAALFQDNIPVEVFHNLINTFKKNIPTWHRYWRIRKKALGVDSLHPYDIWAPLTSASPKVDYAQAVDWICEGMSPLGDEYVGILRRGCLEERWVDVYPNQGKRGGAFSFGWQGTHPFINMSFNNDLKSMSTLAHELGHSMHSFHTWRTQPYVYAGYSLFAAEVASNFNQAMVRAHLMQTQPDRDFQLALIDEAMNNFHRYFFIMPTLAQFELEVHQRAERGEGLTAESMIDLMTDLYAEGYGGEMHIDRQRVGITWAQFSHLFAAYYVYQYATGISAAHALSRRILAGEQGAVDAYLQFLSAGSAVYPIDALKLAGVDMATPEAVEATFAVLSEIVDRLEALVG